MWLENLKTTIRRSMPRRLVGFYRMARYGRDWFTPDGMSTAQIFREVYSRGLWGAGKGPFYSGWGSDGGPAARYVEVIRQFIAARQIRSIVDLGCGDFRVGRQLCAAGISYHGIDIVPELIEYHVRHFSAEGVTFSCRNAIDDELPPGELCLVRQVLQHLSNANIGKILAKLKRFKYVVVTEHVLPAARVVQTNMDIPDGPGTRLERGSFVALDKPPHSLELQTLCEVHQVDGSVLRTDRVLVNGSSSHP